MKKVVAAIALFIFACAGSRDTREKDYSIGWHQGFMACYESLKDMGYASWRHDTALQRMYRDRFGADSTWFKEYYLKGK